MQSLVYSYIHSCPRSLYRSSHSHHSLCCTHQYLKWRKLQLITTVSFTLKHISQAYLELVFQNSINPASTLAFARSLKIQAFANTGIRKNVRQTRKEKNLPYSLGILCRLCPYQHSVTCQVWTDIQGYKNTDTFQSG